MPPPRRRRRRRATAISAISVLAVTGAAVAAYFLLHHAIPGATAQPIAASPDGKMLATVGRNIDLRNITTGHIIAKLTGPHSQNTYNLAFSPDGKMLATDNDGNGIFLWDIATRRVVATLTAPSATGYLLDVSPLAFSPDGKVLAAVDSDNKVYLWDVARLRLITTLQTLPRKVGYDGQINTGQITNIAFSPNSKTLAVSFFGGNGSYRNQPGGELWDIATRRIVTEFPSDDTGDGVVFSPDGKTIVIEDSGTYLLWDVAQKKVRLTLNDPTPTPTPREWNVAGDAAAYSPNGKTLATADGSPNNSVYLWNAATGRRTGTLTDPNSQGVGALAYAQDGRTLAASDGNGNIYLWDVATGRIKATLADPVS